MASNRLFFVDHPARVEAADASWWRAAWFWWLLALISTIPFLLTPLPPLGDLFSHMGRYHVMLNYEKSAWLQRYYTFHWGVVPNLGQDLLMAPIGRIFGVERGAILLSALIPPAMILGFKALSEAAHGRVEATALLALPFSYSFTYLYGFMNYHTGVVVLIWTLLFWLRSSQWPAAIRYAALAALSAAAWLCHLSAWALVVIGVGALEVAAAYDRRGWRLLSEWPSLLLRMVPVLAPAALAVLEPHVAATPLKLDYTGYHLKLYWLAFPLRDQWAPLDVASLAASALVPAALAFKGRLKLHLGLWLFAAATFALFWIVPTALMNGFYADLRLLPVAWFAVLLACRTSASGKLQTRLALFALALFAVRLGFTSYGWYERGRQLNTELEAIHLMPQGARIDVIAPLRTCKSWANDSLTHLASLAIVRRDAFANSEWDIPGQQLMQPIYLRGTPYNTATTLRLPGSTCAGKSASEALAGLPRNRFDYVWMFRAQAPAETRAWLKPVFRGPQGVLYAVVR
jgi:hypothetical protein